MRIRFEFPFIDLLTKLCVAIALSCSLFCSASYGQKTGDGIPDRLVLKPEHGPWFVMAKSYRGPEAKQLAEQLANELRKDFQLTAYCVSKKLDYTERLDGIGFDENGNSRRMKFRDNKVVEGYTVLVGDFDSIDSPAITETLSKIKRITPSMMANGAEPSDPNSDTVSSYRKYLQKIVIKSKENAKENAVANPGPMFGAFVTRNPLLPAEFYKAPELDKFVKKLNEEKNFSDFSLINCAGKYTVRVAVFRGDDQSVSWGRSTNSLSDEDKVSQLDLAAERAALTVRALRRAGYEAYQYHDRSQSYVTVGSFNELGTTNSANQFVYSDRIQEIISRFGGTKKVTRSQYGQTQSPTLLFDLVDQRTIPELNDRESKKLGEWLAKYSVAFDLKPAPMAIPKMPVYNGMLFGKDRR